MPYKTDGFSAYTAVNEAFADAVAAQYRDDDQIWIHDYHFMLLPKMLRARLPNAKIGFFLHIPFPSSEVFRTIPESRELLEGICGADLIGFHTNDYVRHFKSCMHRYFGQEDDRSNRYQFERHQVQVGVYPIGIMFDFFNTNPVGTDSAGKIEDLKNLSPDTKILLAIDRLDYTKGVIRRLLAFEELMRTYPDLRGNIILIQVAVKCRMDIEEYESFKREVDQHTGRINGEFGDIHYQPVHYISQNFSQEELIGLYQQADAMLVTPLRDGMNIVAKEYVAARTDCDGVLVLSEFAGAADEMTEALLINPYDIKAVADAMHTALNMPLEERQNRMKFLRDRVQTWQNTDWARSFIADLESTSKESPDLNRNISGYVESLVESCEGQINLFLDYDGTLVPIEETPELAFPDKELIAKLMHLAGLSGVNVHLVSGRKKETLEEWFGGLPIHLHGEHGVWSKTAHSKAWVSTYDDLSYDKNQLLKIANIIANETPGAFVEEKTFGFAWHFRSCDPVDARRGRTRLTQTLQQFDSQRCLEVIDGKMVLEVRPLGLGKGDVIKQSRAESSACLNIAIGDDTTDEQMFAELSDSDLSIHVGTAPSKARFNLKDTDEVHVFLDQFIKKRSENTSLNFRT